MTFQLVAQDWAKEAACRLTSNPEPFYPEKSARRGDAEIAKAMCQRCPVANDCLADAMDRHEAYGIWGGLDEHERKHLARSKRLVAR